MIPVTRTACALFIAAALASPAFAAAGDAGSGPTTGATKTNDAGSGPTNGAASNPGSSANASGRPGMGAQGAGDGMHVAQKVRDDLSKAGFTDIHVMPSSFLVRAKDSSGNPVMMVINPDSITAVTEEQGGTSSAQGSTGRTGASQPGTQGGAKTSP